MIIKHISGRCLNFDERGYNKNRALHKFGCIVVCDQVYLCNVYGALHKAMKVNALNNNKPLTLEDVAKEIGVSRSTVSAAFTGKGSISAARKNAVRSAAIKLGYRPNPHAQRLANGDIDNTIALVTSSLDLDVRSQKLQLIQRILLEKGYNASIHALGTGLTSELINADNVIGNLRRLQPLAIICNQWELNQSTRNELQHFCEEGGKLVYYDVPMELECDQVIFDREHNSYIAMKHLLELGHREVGFFLPPDDAARLHGTRKAVDEFDITMRSTWIDAPRQGRYEEAGGHLAEYFITQNPRPTAMSIVNDNVAIGFVAGLQRHGLRIPQDVSVVSHNDTTAAKWGANVSLTSVSQPIETIAQKTAKLLIDRLTDTYNGPPRTVIVQGSLSIRDSTALFDARNKGR